MAFQRPFLISLKRSDSSQRWGFSIAGGKEYGEPLRIQMVADDSTAERCGLHENDEIIQVGRVNVQDMTQGQVYELLARCGNKIEMFVIREDLFSPRKGKEPPVIKAVVHNPYNSPLQLYSTDNVAETLAKQTEVLTEGQISADEDEGPENLSFKQKSAVFQLLEEQSKQETGVTRGSPQRQTVVKPKAAPPPPPKPKPPAQEALYNGYDTSHRQVYQDHQKSSHVEYQNQTTQKVVNQYQYQHQYQQEQPVQYQQSNVYQTSSYQKSPGYQPPFIEKNYSPGYQSPAASYQQQRTQQQIYQQSNNQQPQSPHSPGYQQYPGYQSPTAASYQALNQVNYQQTQQQQSNKGYQATQPKEYQIQIKTTTSQQAPNSPTAVSKAEFKIGPPPPPRVSSTKQQDSSNMTAVYKQQYEQHLQQQFDQQQAYMNNIDDVGSPPKAHIIKEDIFEHNSSSGTPITYKAPPAAPPKPNWPPPPTPEQFCSPAPLSPTNMRVDSVWPPKKSTVTDLPRTGFNPAAVREQGTGRRCVWPPPKSEDEYRSGRSTPQSPQTGRRIQWNPSPSPPTSRRVVFGTSNSPVRRKDIQWPPPSPTSMVGERQTTTYIQGSPRLTRKGRFEDYIKEHASINVPQTYRPPPGTQHVEYR